MDPRDAVRRRGTSKVKPLLNIGGLVKYPMGKGGLVLNQLLAKPSEAVPVNAQKKQAIVATLLRNLHATFAGGRILTAANLKFQPLPLEEQCNQYLTKDRGWFGGGRDLAHLPIGNQDFGGVPYVIRDFRTSPLPSCVMLAGPGVGDNCPTAVQGLRAELQGGRPLLPARLQPHGPVAARPARPIPRPCCSSTWSITPTARRAEVPVLYGEGADHWLSKDPAGLKSAALAWAAPFPAQKSDEQAVVYQFTWNNPRPEVAIATIDLEYGDRGKPLRHAGTAGDHRGHQSRMKRTIRREKGTVPRLSPLVQNIALADGSEFRDATRPRRSVSPGRGLACGEG